MSDEASNAALIGQALERAIDDLPEGYQLSLHLGAGYGVVLLFSPDGDTLPISAGEADLAQILTSAVDTACGLESRTKH